MFKDNTTNNQYAKEAAKWLLEDILIEKEMEKLSAIHSNEDKK